MTTTCYQPTPAAISKSKAVWWAVGQIVLGMVTACCALVASVVILFCCSRYDGSTLTGTDIHDAHIGQLLLLGVAVVCAVPWVAVAALRRRNWPLQLAIGLLVGVIPLPFLLTHLPVTSWLQPNLF